MSYERISILLGLSTLLIPLMLIPAHSLAEEIVYDRQADFNWKLFAGESNNFSEYDAHLHYGTAFLFEWSYVDSKSCQYKISELYAITLLDTGKSWVKEDKKK